MSLTTLFSKLKGGPGSGNLGHAGIPGHRGGSAPKSSLSTGELKKVNSTFVEYFKKMDNRYYQTAANINTGFCYEWAYVTHKKFGSELWVNQDFSHAFIKDGDLFYDAGTTKGVKDWVDLKGLAKQRKSLLNLAKHGVSRTAENLSEDDFKSQKGFHIDQANEILGMI